LFFGGNVNTFFREKYANLRILPKPDLDYAQRISQHSLAAGSFAMSDARDRHSI
jgi:hypothetical protein